MKTTGTWDCACVNLTRPSVILYRYTDFSGLEPTACDAFYVTVFKVSVFIGGFGRFSVDDKRKRLKKYAFSNENVLVWMELETSFSVVHKIPPYYIAKQ